MCRRLAKHNIYDGKIVFLSWNLLKTFTMNAKSLMQACACLSKLFKFKTTENIGYFMVGKPD